MFITYLLSQQHVRCFCLQMSQDLNGTAEPALASAAELPLAVPRTVLQTVCECECVCIMHPADMIYTIRSYTPEA